MEIFGEDAEGERGGLEVVFDVVYIWLEIGFLVRFLNWRISWTI